MYTFSFSINQTTQSFDIDLFFKFFCNDKITDYGFFKKLAFFQPNLDQVFSNLESKEFYISNSDVDQTIQPISQLFVKIHSDDELIQFFPEVPTRLALTYEGSTRPALTYEGEVPTRLALTYEGSTRPALSSLTYVISQDFLVSFPVLTSSSSIILLIHPMIEFNHLPHTSPAPIFSEGRITKLDRNRTSAFTSIPLGLFNHLSHLEVEEFQRQDLNLHASKKDLSDDDVTDPADDYEKISIEDPFDDDSCEMVESPTDDDFEIV